MASLPWTETPKAFTESTFKKPHQCFWPHCHFGSSSINQKYQKYPLSLFQLLFIRSSMFPAHSQTTFPKRQEAEEHTQPVQGSMCADKTTSAPSLLDQMTHQGTLDESPWALATYFIFFKDKTRGFTSDEDSGVTCADKLRKLRANFNLSLSPIKWPGQGSVKCSGCHCLEGWLGNSWYWLAGCCPTCQASRTCFWFFLQGKKIQQFRSEALPPVAAPSTVLPKKEASPSFTGYWKVSHDLSLNRNSLLNLILPSTQQQEFQKTHGRNEK